MPNNLSAKSHPHLAVFFAVFCLCPGVTALILMCGPNRVVN